jgi:hypothetical protein
MFPAFFYQHYILQKHNDFAECNWLQNYIFIEIIVCRNLKSVECFRNTAEFFCRQNYSHGFSSGFQKLSAGQYTFWEPGSPVPPLFAPLV